VSTGFAPSGRLVDAADEFGRELRRRRTRAGLTQRELAMHVQYSRETVAAVERGRRFASREFAVRCDEVLGTGGVLTRLWPLVETMQLAADRRRGPRPIRLDRGNGPVRLDPAGRAAIPAGWAALARPSADDEFMVTLRELLARLAPSGGAR
jgi:transcriptional regulator with XRE-family HTH domain